jgi:hypothetical protein
VPGACGRCPGYGDGLAARVKALAGGPADLVFDTASEFTRLAAAGKFTVPVACAFPLDQWRMALDISQASRARGKLAVRKHAVPRVPGPRADPR